MSIPPYRKVGKIKICVDRPVAGSYVNGEWVEPSPTTFTTIGNIQPNFTWNMLQKLPEGDRSKRAIAIYCNKELLMAKQGAAEQKADIVHYDGDLWEVKVTQTWKMGVLDHCEAVAIKVDDV